MKARTLICINICFMCALFLRLFLFDLKPLHSDEGVHAWMLVNLYRTGAYQYIPSMHHGPFLYYLGLIPFYLLGINTFSLRLLPALFNSSLLLLLIPLRKRIGEIGVVAGGILLALSPIDVFYSREIIHESYFVFFSLAAVVFASRYVETRKSWFVLGASASFAFLLTIKETVVITVSVWMAALAGAFIADILYVERGMRKIRLKELLTKACAEVWRLKFVLILCFFMILAISIALYSSFFTHWQGVSDFFSGVKTWTRQGIEGEGHEKPFFYYLDLLTRYELPILLLGLMGIVYGLRRRDRFSIFVSLWAFFVFVVYSCIPYKTPWLLLNIVLPLFILSGFSTNEILNRLISRKGLFIVAVNVAFLMACFLGYHAVKVSFYEYDNDSHPLTYVQTKKDVNRLVGRIEGISNLWPEGKQIEIKILTPHYWPLPWYLRDYYRVGYFGEIIDEADASLVIVSSADEEELTSRLKDTYHTERYELRQGVSLILYIRGEIWERCNLSEG